MAEVQCEVELAWGKAALRCHIPAGNLVGVYSPPPLAACADAMEEARRALANPLDTPPLSRLVQPGEKVLILVDDHTRATPVAEVLPAMLGQLGSAGVAEGDITILVTHGTHRLSTPEEVQAKVGEEVCRRFRVLQHRADDEASQVFLGVTSRGTPVWVNRLVMEADRCLGIGHIGPSPYAGYSGGGKLILPGAAALDTIDANHSLVAVGFRRHGWVEGPCRQDIDEAAALARLDLVLDVVLNQEERVVRAFAGTPARVFREGLPLARRAFEVPCPGQVDVAITSGFPYDIDLYQAVRAVEYADVAVRPGGSILLVAACPQGVGGDEFRELLMDRNRKPDAYLRDVVRRRGKVTFGVLGYFLARIRAEKELYIVGSDIPRADLEAMGFGCPASLQAGVDALLQKYGPRARVAVFPQGSGTIPVVS